jgi:dienelactone hydrolase
MSRAHRGLAALAGLPLLLLLACGGGTDVKSVPPPNSGDQGSSQSGVFPVFDPSPGASQFIPLPNVLVTGAANDPLTNPTGTGVPRAANSPMTPPEAMAYVNVYEMAKTNAVSGVNAPIYIRFSAPVDPASLAGNVRVFQVAGDTATGGLTENGALTFTDVTALFSRRYVAGSTDLFLFPNFPLLPGTKYAYLVNSAVKDAATGKSLISSVAFTALKSTTPLSGAFAALEPARIDTLKNPLAPYDSTTNPVVFRGFAHTMDDLIAASATTGVASRADIAVLGRFITTGAGFVVPDPVGAPSTRIPMESALRKFAAGATLGGLSGKTWSNTVSGFGPATLMIKGNTSPLPTPDNYWQAVTGSGTATAPATVGLVALGTFASGDLNIDPVVAKANAATMNLTGVTGAYNPAAGVTQTFRDNTGVLTGFYHTDRTVNFVYIAPDPALITRPANGYPLVIYQHGITSQKETVIALATALTAKGYALIAIDLPVHGQNAVPGHTTGAQWGTDFMAVGAPLATRTNLQQAVVNLTRLELVVKTGGLSTALAANSLATSTPDITTSPSNIKFVGVSLGAITGAYYLASNTTLTASVPPYTQSSLDNDMKGFLNCPGGRTAYLIGSSPAFGPQVDAGLASVGIVKNSPTYHSFFQLTQSVVDPADPATLTTPLAAGLPSRLSGRVTIQEATSSTFDAFGNTTSTDGDQVISNAYTRYFANALGGREVLGTAGSAVGPNFKQLAYTAGGAYQVGGNPTAHAAGVVGTPFMFTLSPGPTPKVANAATQVTDTTPKEGYFQFDQTGIGHAFILNPANPVAISLGQRQLVYWLATGLVVDPTQQSGTLPIVSGTALPEPMIFQAPEQIRILGH